MGTIEDMRKLAFTGILISLFAAMVMGQRSASLRGQVTDQMGAVVVGASVTLMDQNRKEQVTQTDDRGTFYFNGLPPGIYDLRITQTGFATYDKTGLNVGPAITHHDVQLSVTIETQRVTIGDERSLSTDPASNANALVIKGKDLDALSDDPTQLAAQLSALVGPAAGPNGAEFYVDGFAVGQNNLPDKQSIREIVINRNPFSAEYDRIGFANVDIFTKPGTGKMHGGATVNFSDAVLNSRNPYAINRPPYQRRIYQFNLSGPLGSKKASYFVSFGRPEVNDNTTINAKILDNSLNVRTLSQAVVAPFRATEFSPRFDVQLNKTNTLIARFSFAHGVQGKQGIGGFSLTSRGYSQTLNQPTIRLTETAIMSPRIVNETRFLYTRIHWSRLADDLSPGIIVLDAFAGGGSPIGKSSTATDRWDTSNITTLIVDRHTLKFGVRLRGEKTSDVSPTDFAGTNIFAGGRALKLDAQNQIQLGSDGQPIFVDITSIERYRRTLLFQRLGFSSAQIRTLGGGATQLTISSGNPLTEAKQLDVGAFVQDDWKLRPDFTLSLGVRYLKQTNIRNSLNFAPRLAFAWTPWFGGGDQPNTVVRGGAGVFYDLINNNLTLQVDRYNGLNQKQFIVTDPALLDSFPQIPALSALVSQVQPQTIWRKATDLRDPYYIQSSISVEQSLPHQTTLTATYLETRGLHQLRARNLNAPLPGTFVLGDSASGVRPFGNKNNVYDYETSGSYRQHLLAVSLSLRPTTKLTLTSNYTLAKTNSDTDGAGTFPGNSYDLSAEYGRASTDIRHRLTLIGTIDIKWGISLNPLLVASSGTPFNITTGLDGNGDSIFSDRPGFASDLGKASVRVTPFGSFDLVPALGQRIIPRNFGNGPGYFSVNLRVAKTFGLGHFAANAQAKTGSQPGRAATKPEDRPYKLTMAVSGTNIFNHTNPGLPIGNLTSPFFGTSNSMQAGQFSLGGNGANNRAVNLTMSFSF